MDERARAAFYSKIDASSGPNKCWPWTGAKNSRGYGNVRIDGKYCRAHRVVWELEHFKIPSGYIVMHACDNPTCCNPAHLSVGTMASNTVDMMTKCRMPKERNSAVGERNVNAKLTGEAVAVIRSAKINGNYNREKLASRYNVCKQTITNAASDKTWRHVK